MLPISGWAINFREQLTDITLKEIDGVNPKNKEKFVAFIRNLKPDDNPVIRIVYLKKDIRDHENTGTIICKMIIQSDCKLFITMLLINNQILHW